MFRDVAFGQYYPTNSAVHRLDARVKLLLTITYVVSIFFIKGYFGFMVAAALLILTVIVARLPILSVLKSVRGILLIVLITAVLNLFLIKDGEPLFEYGVLMITKNGVHTAIKMILRLVLLISGASLLPLTTTPVELADGLESLMTPLKVIRVPVRDIAMIMSIALRFIPTLFEETNKIMNAQKARGAAIDNGNVFRRIGAILSVLVPLFISSFRRADELAFALDARCYNATDKRTRMKKATLRWADAVAVVIVLAFFTVILLDKYYFGSVGVDIDAMIFGSLL